MTFFPKLKARIDAGNQRWLDSMPVHERDQTEAAARTWRGAFAYKWRQVFGRAR